MSEVDKGVAPGVDSISEMIRTRVTCPFIGSAVNQGLLAVDNGGSGPLASIDAVKAMGNIGGGDLGQLLALFAQGNHAFMPGDSGQLTEPVPNNMFSLDFPGSQGSHAGHSGILEGSPKIPGSGRFDEEAFGRLAARAVDGRLTRRAVGEFIAENVRNDREAQTIGAQVVVRMGQDLFELFESAVPELLANVIGHTEQAQAAHREVAERMTKLLAEDNVAGSSGEFGLLFALLANRPDAIGDDGESSVSMEDVLLMFKDKRLPAGWDERKKTRLDWARHTLAIVSAAYSERG